jgi:uncharacterized protein (DUF1330 family)
MVAQQVFACSSKEEHMRTRFVVGISLACGIALGAGGLQALHAQGKPKAYLVSESEILNEAELASYTAEIGKVQKAAGGRGFGTRGKVVASIGNAPQRVGISEWDNMDAVFAYLKSPERTKLLDGSKAVKITRQYVVEASK